MVITKEIPLIQEKAWCEVISEVFGTIDDRCTGSWLFFTWQGHQHKFVSYMVMQFKH